MPRDFNTGLSEDYVLKVLEKLGLISEDQKKEVFTKKKNVRRKLERLRAARQASSPTRGRLMNPITIIDVITQMELKRADDPATLLDEETIFQALSKAWKIPYKKIDPLKLDLNLVTTTIPHGFAMKHLVLPIAINDGYLTVATPDPFNQEAIQDIAQVSHLRVKPVVSTKTDIIKLINEFFGFKRSIMAAETQFGGPAVDLGNLEQYVRLRSSDELPSNDQHIVNAVDHLFSYAFDQRSSDVHIEPKRDKSMVRLRIDGTLHTVYELPKNVHSAIVSRIKNLARLDMAEKRRPQDGRIKMEKGGVEAEIRVSSVPVAFGEKLVMRIMDPDILFQELGTLGFTSMDLLRYEQFINMPHGIVLVCGPTGSGKSTTLYSTLRYLSSPDINITTVEDPIEMVHEEFNQIAVQPVIGITFASILRNILRQDPDIIMIGEMRDLDTAENAIQAALTGHLVLSTLHTNDAPSSVTRLLDLGVPPYMIKATVLGVMAQRLVRTLCPHCKVAEPTDAEAWDLMSKPFRAKPPAQTFAPQGCLECRDTGYLGRMGIYELLPMTEKVGELVSQDCDVEALRRQALKEGMRTLRLSGAQKVGAGLTTVAEVLRVSPASEA
jgi:general secretion pathway protein E